MKNMPKSYIAPRYLGYEKEWEIDPTYAGWIAPIKNSKEGAQCKYCGIILVADVTSLDSHATSDLHMSNMPNSNYFFPGAKYKKVFQGYWLRNPLFKDWLEPVKGATSKARCKYCNTYISARHSSLLKHASTVKHKKYCKKNNNKNSNDNFYVKSENEDDNYDNNNEENDDINYDDISEGNNETHEADSSFSNMEEAFVLVPASEVEIENEFDNLQDNVNSYDINNSNMLDLECEEVDENAISINKKDMINGNVIKKTRFSSEVGYNSEWESNSLFKDWLSSVKDDRTRAQCIVCLHRMVANYDQLIAHGNSQRHRINMKETGEMEEHSDQEDVKPLKKKYQVFGYNRETFYKDEWEENPLFKDWITRVRNCLEKARCRYCSKVMLATSQQLMSHLKSDRHKRNRIIHLKKKPVKDEEIKNEQSTLSKDINPTMTEIQKEWENDPLFKDWIKFIDNDNSKVECKICLRRMYATRFQLLNHIGSRLHQKNTADNVQKHLIYDEEDANFTEFVIDPLAEKEEDDIYNDPSDPFVNNNIRVRVLYRHEWQDDKHLKDWISAVPETDKKAFCNVCNMQIRACYPALRIHGRAPHHLTKMMKLGFNPPATKSILDPINGLMYNVPEAMDDVEEVVDMKVEIDTKRSKSYRLGYQFGWEKDENFKDWIIRIKKNDYKVGCRYCRSQMRATLTQLNTHMASDRHILMKMLADEEEDSKIGEAERKDETDLEEEDQEYFEEYDSNNRAKKYRRKYLKSWEKDYVMRDWIEPVPGYPYKALCKYCGVLIAAKRTSLTSHAQSTKHIKKMRTKNEHIGIVKGFENEKKFIHAPCMDTQQKIWAKYCRTYCKSWELNPLFKSWIERVPGDITRARCKFCHVLLRARLIELKSHVKTWKHAASMAQAKNEISNVTTDVTENCEPNLNVVVAQSRTSVAAQKPKRKISNAGCSLTSTKLVKNVALDLHRTDDSLAPVKCLEKMMTVFPAFNPNSNARTLFVGSGSSLDSSAIDGMMEADPSTVFTIKQGTDPNKRKKKKVPTATLR